METCRRIRFHQRKNSNKLPGRCMDNGVKNSSRCFPEERMKKPDPPNKSGVCFSLPVSRIMNGHYGIKAKVSSTNSVTSQQTSLGFQIMVHFIHPKSLSRCIHSANGIDPGLTWIMLSKSIYPRIGSTLLKQVIRTARV